mgnify:CR=1 FL=1
MSNTVEYDILVEVLGAVKDLKKLQKQTKKTKGGLDETGKSGVAMAGQIGAAFTGLAAAGAIVTGAIGRVAGAFTDAARASFELTRAVVDNINDLNDLSNVSGISAQNIEALKLAFVSSGQSAESANTILQQFPRVLTSIQKGTGDASAAFEVLGLKSKDVSGKFKNADQVFGEIIGKLQGIKDQTTQAQLATAIFGRSAAGVVQALGAGDFDEFTDAIDRFGTKATPEASAAAADFQKNLALLQFITERVKQTFLDSFGGIEAFNGILIRAVASLQAVNVFFKNGSGAIKQFAVDVVEFGVKAVKSLTETLLNLVFDGLGSAIRVIDTFSEAVGLGGLSGQLKDAIGVAADFSAEKIGLTNAIQAATAAYQNEIILLRDSTSATEENKDQVDAQVEEYKKLIEEFNKLLKSRKKDTDETDKNTKAVKKNTKAESERRKLIADSLKRMMQATKSITSIQREANSDLLSDLDKINQLEKERLIQLKRITDQQKLSTEEAQRAVSARAERERAAVTAQSQAGAISAVGQAVQAASDPSALVNAIGAAFGPKGAAVSGIISGLASFGDASQIDEEKIADVMEKEGKNRDQAIRQILLDDKAAEFEIFFEAIVRGVGLLPAMLIKTLPTVLLPAALDIVGAIALLPFQLIGEIGSLIMQGAKMIGEFVKGLSPMEVLKKLFNAIMEPLTNIVNSVLGIFGLDVGGPDSFMGGGRMMSAQGGLRFTGRDQGLAMLHQGEMVVPRSGQMSSSVARDMEAQTGGGGGVTININSAVTERSAIDSLVRKIEQRFGGFGQSTSPLFGGQ